MSEQRARPKSAWIIVVGNEILSGRIHDTNSHWLCRRLYQLGISVKRIVTVPDEVGTIAEALRVSTASSDYVMITGGIGPTPDDVTRRAVALAFDRQLVSHPEAERAVRRLYRDNINPYRLEMACLPEGSRYIESPRFAAPGFCLENVFVFPGVPQLMQEMFERILPELEAGAFYESRIEARMPESEFSQILYSLDQDPDVSIGSYPTLHEDGRWTVTVIVSGTDKQKVQEVADQLSAQLRELERSKGERESH